MENILKLIKINLKLLLNSKKSLVLLLIGPLLLVSLAVLAFDNNNTYNLNLGIYAESPTDLGHAYIKSLKENLQGKAVSHLPSAFSFLIMLQLLS